MDYFVCLIPLSSEEQLKEPLVKAFGRLSASSLAQKVVQKPGLQALFYASDKSWNEEVIASLIRQNGFDLLRIEVFADLHEFGALEKTVDLKDLKEAKEWV